MYAGHAAIALFVKGKRPAIPIAVLVPLAFGPDWVAWVSELLGHRNELISHSLVAVVLGGAAAALIYFLFARSRIDALAVGLTYVSHWPADFITGLKPTWPGGPEVGLQFYGHRTADVVLESLLVIACWLVYRASLPAKARRRRIGLLIPAGLIGLQIGFALIQLPAIKDPLKEAVTELRT